MTSAELCEALRGGLPALFECVPNPHGGVHIFTHLLYPDGGVVDVFVVRQENDLLVTDHGDGLGWLRMQSASGKLSPKQRWMVDDVCKTLGVSLHQGQLQLQCESPAALAEAVDRVAQAVLRVSDIWFTFRTRSTGSIADELHRQLPTQPQKPARCQ